MATEPNLTLTDILDRELLPFSVGSQQFYVRQPLPDEYDDGESLKTLTYQKMLAADYVKDVADLPCSQGERALFELVLQDTQKRYDALGETENAYLKAQLAAEISRLQADLGTRTLAEEVASDKATLVRDRWLTMRLLCDGQGQPLFDLQAADFNKRWAKLSVKIKDAARPAIWKALQLVREAPFSSAP